MPALAFASGELYYQEQHIRETKRSSYGLPPPRWQNGVSTQPSCQEGECMNCHHLSIEERSCIRKYYVDGLSCHKIARLIGRNVSTV